MQAATLVLGASFEESEVEKHSTEIKAQVDELLRQYARDYIVPIQFNFCIFLLWVVSGFGHMLMVIASSVVNSFVEMVIARNHLSLIRTKPRRNEAE